MTNPTSTPPTSLPESLADYPEIQAIDQVTVDFYQLQAMTRARVSDPIAAAHTIVPAWQNVNAFRANGREQVLGQYKGLLSYLDNRLPLGPPPSTPGESEADKIIKMTAWRANLQESRAASNSDLDHRLEDAVAFGDDLALRAGVTAYMERDGGRERVTKWLLGVSGDADLIAKAQKMHDDYPLFRARLFQLTAPLPAPDELAQLQAAEQAAAAAKAAAQTSARSRFSDGLFG